MQTLQSFVFFENADANAVSNELGSPNRSSQLILQVSGNPTGLNMEVQGVTDIYHGDYQPLAVINLVQLSKQTTVTAEGIYAVPMDGISRVRCEIKGINGGSVTVYGRLGE